MIYRKVMKYLQELFEDEITLYIGNNIINFLSMETIEKYSTFLIEDTNLDFISIATGMAMTSNKKIIVVFDDNYLLKHYSSLLQAAISKCYNLFFIVLVTNNYRADLLQTNLFNSVSSVKGSIYEMGFLTHIHDRFFKNKKMFDKFKISFNRFIGPSVGIIDVDNSKFVQRTTNVDNDITTFIDFVRYIPDTEDILNTKKGVNLIVKET